MTQQEPLLQWSDGVPYFSGLRVEHRTVTIAGRDFKIFGLTDAADLLEQPDYAERFLEADIAPYGVELWPAALMLAHHILGDDDGMGRQAIELGCGLGLVSIAATVKGWRVLATDNEPTSLRFTKHNAAINQTVIDGCELLDWHHPPTSRSFDRVFAADVLYQLVDHAPVLECIDLLLADGGVGVVADPNRGIADRFASLAVEHGFAVDVSTVTAPNANGKVIEGRIFRLARHRREPGTRIG